MIDKESIDRCLPQTQCQECGYKACLPYAEAIANGEETIDKCAPGGVETLFALANLVQSDPTPYISIVEKNHRIPAIVKIREDECIGCTKCIQACPVDAIVGSNKMMHSIIEADCTGCQLCIEPCPVDCIEIKPLASPQFDKEQAKQQYQNRQARLKRKEEARRQQYMAKKKLSTKENDIKAKQSYIERVLKRKLSPDE